MRNLSRLRRTKACAALAAASCYARKEAQEVLDRAGITVNKNAIPFDTYPIFKPGGIRVGTPAVTTRGMKEEEMLETADLIAEALRNRSDAEALQRVHEKVRELTRRFPIPF